MRNIIISEDSSSIIDINNDDSIVAIENSSVTLQTIILTSQGRLYILNNEDGTFTNSLSGNIFIDLNVEDIQNNEWFYVSTIIETNSILCVSRQGNIVRLSMDHNSQSFDSFVPEIEKEGQVDDGIACAQWNPEKSILVILSNNNTLLFMTVYMELVIEITIDSRQSNTPAAISWRSDGSCFALSTTDMTDNLTRIRFYSKDGEFMNVGRNVAEGAASIVRGVSSAAVAYAPNNTLVALPLQKTPTRMQIAFLEPNGLRHGEFDLQLPANSVVQQDVRQQQYKVSTLHWDIATSILAVGFAATNIGAEQSETGHSSSDSVNIVQLYTRGNYHWYLKQQFSGTDMICLGFDSEIANILYFTQTLCLGGSSSSSSTKKGTYLRMVDLLWDVCTSEGCSDCSAAVVDGCQVLLTPLGISAVPPPMSAHKSTLSHACNLCSFWKLDCQCATCIDQAAIMTEGTDNNLTDQPTIISSKAKWGLVCVSDMFSLQLVFGSERGAPMASVHIDTDALITQLEVILNNSSTVNYTLYKHNIFCKSVTCSQSARSRSMVMRLLVHILGQGTFIICASVDTASGEVLSLSMLSGSTAAVFSNINYQPANCIKCLVSSQDVSCRLGVLGVSSASSFEVKFFDMKLSDEQSDKNGKSETVQNIEWLGESVMLPEPCRQISLITTRSTALDSSTAVPAPALSKNDSTSRDDKAQPLLHWTAVGLSAKGRFYCGEVMLANGASSYSLNTQLDLLLYVTIGTRPQLHYMSISALVGLSSLHGQHTEEQYFLEVGESRPVERGAKLIASVHGEAKVVIQLPRGNLEIFEPRTLLLTKVRLLLQEDRLFDSLVILRRQKIDLNYLFDYDPSILLYNMKAFIERILNVDPEFLSLFLSSLEPSNASTVKYPIAIIGHVNQSMNQLYSEVKYKEILQNEQLTLHELFAPAAAASSSGNGSTSAAVDSTKTKVNAVCRYVRKELNAILMASTSSVGSEKVLHPLLCTYARQRPPLLEEALEYISQQFAPESIALNSSATSVATNAATTGCGGGGDDEVSTKAAKLISLLSKKRAAILSSPKVQSALKYLSFLAEGSKLFDSAVGMGDFAMARATARQCQMDPKVYIPLLERFESILNITAAEAPPAAPSSADEDFSGGDQRDRVGLPLVEYRYQLMFFEVNLHLNRYMQTIDFAVKALQAKLQLTETIISAEVAAGNDIIENIVFRSEDSLCDCLFKLTFDHELYAKTIPLLSKVLLTASYRGSHVQATAVADSSKQKYSLLHGKVKLLLNRVRIAYGANRQSKQQYDEAIAAYLLSDPPSYTDAINVAKMNGNWRQAITLVGRQAMYEKVSAGVGKSRMQKIVSEIVTDFKASQDQGNTEADDATFQSIIPSYILSSSAHTHSDHEMQNHTATTTTASTLNVIDIKVNSSEVEQDRALEAADLCITFLEDVESAVEILLASRHWLRAIDLCVRFQRHDLLFQEVSVHVREASLYLTKLLPAVASKQQTLVNELTCVFWDKPESRVSKLKEIDPDSFKRSTADTVAAGMNDKNAVGDNQSEYSVSSHLSRVSYQSHFSVMSGSSQLSRQSTSTSVSVLSNLSFSKTSHASSILSKGDNFSIAGLDHNLLSRGEHSEWEKQNPNNISLNKGGQIKRQDKQKISEKRQKKHDRKRGQRILGNDVMNLGREKDICAELWNIAQFHLMTNECTRLCDALLMLNGTHTYATGQLTDEVLSFLQHTRAVNTTDSNGTATTSSSSSQLEISDKALAMLLQSLTDDMAIALKTHIPPVAPRYPRHFLEKKHMLVITRFQDTSTAAAASTTNKQNSQFEDNADDIDNDDVDANEDEDASFKPVKSWWQTAADAIIAWENMRKVNLTV